MGTALGKGVGREGQGGSRGNEGGEGEGREKRGGQGSPSLAQIPGSAPTVT